MRWTKSYSETDVASDHYPVLLETEYGGQYSGSASNDQFQWDVELEPSVFEPNIPPDYEQM